MWREFMGSSWKMAVQLFQRWRRRKRDGKPTSEVRNRPCQNRTAGRKMVVKKWFRWGDAPAEPPPNRSADIFVGVVPLGTDWPTKMSALRFGHSSAGASPYRNHFLPPFFCQQFGSGRAGFGLRTSVFQWRSHESQMVSRLSAGSPDPVDLDAIRPLAG